MNFIWYILIGIIAGYVAGKITRGGGFGLLVNLVLGIIGGVLGGWVFYPVSVDCFIIQPFPLIFCDTFIILTNIN